MIEKLAEIEKTHQELTQRLSDPAIFSDPKAYREVNKTLSEIDPAVRLYREYVKTRRQREENDELLASLAKDDDLYEMVQEEKQQLVARVAELEEQLRRELTPKDPNDERNVVLEIRAGTGGDEASLFAAELFRMYTRYAEQQGWRVEVIDLSESGAGGIKEVSAIVEGRGAYSRLKYEGGVHRVQRVPATESAGRIHTSAVTVAVLPEADEVEVEVDEKDLRIDRFCASGPGGQGVNTTYSAVRLTHLPLGPRGLLPGRAQPDQEQGEGAPRAEGAAVRDGAREGRFRDERGAPQNGGLRRPLGEDPHLQLPPEPGDGPPHRPVDPSAPHGHGRQPRSPDRAARPPTSRPRRWKSSRGRTEAWPCLQGGPTGPPLQNISPVRETFSPRPSFTPS